MTGDDFNFPSSDLMKIHVGLAALLIACTGGEDIIEKQDNSAPSILVASHSASIGYLKIYESFRATVSDDDNDFSELTVTGTSMKNRL